MSHGGPKRTRSQRVAAIELPPGRFERTLDYLRRGDVLLRIAMCLLATLVMWVLMSGWAPPFPYRTGYTPARSIVSRVDFKLENRQKTLAARNKARDQVRWVYTQDARPLVQLRGALRNKILVIRDAKTAEDVDPEIWKEFLPPDMPRPTIDEIAKMREGLGNDENLEAFDQAVARAFSDIEQKGILEKVNQGLTEGDQTTIQGDQLTIQVHSYDTTAQFPVLVAVSDVQRGEAISKLKVRLRQELPSQDVAERVFTWLEPSLRKMTTLTVNREATNAEQEAAVKKIEDQYDPYKVGDILAISNSPLDLEKMQLLKAEDEVYLQSRTTSQKVSYSLAVMGMFAALFVLCGFYTFYRERRLITSLKRFSQILGMVVITVAVCLVAKDDKWRAEIIPLLLFGMIVAITYHQELALLLSAAVALVVVFAMGQGLAAFVTLLSGVAAAVLLLGPIRSRIKLVYVGVFAGLVSSLTAIGAYILDGQPVDANLFQQAAVIGGLAVLASFLMTGLLPFIEKFFGVLTDISLLELGDVAHPLLQELVRRAPGTYNHSINVASIAQAAAEAIGARGLLVRVGAYFHDIGKMLKPQYFAENQGADGNRHETLMPAMSTLIIIAHIKDGADLARQHHLPQPLIDFVQQHHGTTLVEYFYHRANMQSEADPNGSTVDESAFRYPGPKPQSKEAGVLMLADAVESASRVLVNPTPARIESLVHEIAMKRLLDRQFDESGLTLQEVRLIEESLVKSQTAVYHGRVKYPDQRTA